MIPDDLRAIRLDLGWTQDAAAEHLGVNLRTYRYYEAGETSSGTQLARVPKAIALAMLAQRFVRDITAL
jgi:transcriptional regulator with XRE-family HTH domain